MKLINKTLLLLTASATILASCNKFDDLNTNPDAATKVTAPVGYKTYPEHHTTGLC
jgi:hypothetical protein